MRVPTLTPSTGRPSTTEMEVTSIRLERELKDELKKIAGNRGYQALIRDLLWDYVQGHSHNATKQQISVADIRATLPATAQQLEHCALTNTVIQPQQPMLLGLTLTNQLLPLSLGSMG
jgi:hypothetical protein